MIRKEQRRHVAADIEQLMQDPEEVKLAREIAEASTRELAGRLAQLERGES
jgi:hypothetical protein